MLDLDRLVQEIAAKDLRYRRLGFTDEDANRYYDDLYFGATETEAQERLLDGRSLTVEDRHFVLEFLKPGKPGPFQFCS